MQENPKDVIRIPFETMNQEFSRLLIEEGFTKEKADKCAAIFSESSLDGVYSHGVNRFPRFIRYIRKGYVKTDAVPTPVHQSGTMEQWNGNLGPGPLNADFATHRAMQLAENHGMGLVALANTNHWMRGGTYGWLAAKSGFVFIGWTNTMPNMPAWGGKNPKLGNNPLVIAIPYGNEAIVLDMAMSQYSFGTMESKKMQHQTLPTPGGYDTQGNLTDDPGEILKSWRSLPVGYWKGSALSLMLDILAATLSGGASTAAIGRNEEEYGVSQVFIAINPAQSGNFPAIEESIRTIIEDYKTSIPAESATEIRYPGERILANRALNLKKGIPVNRKIWEEIMGL